MIKRLKRGLAIVVSITTLAWAVGPAMLLLPTRVMAAEAQPGDLIKMASLSSVYYLGADNKRYVFPNQTTYFSWYKDFSTVKTISQSELESYGLGKNITMREGTKLVKITTDPKVYAVEPGGVLKWIPDEATAKTLYGTNWAKRVIDVPDSYFTNYTVSSEQVSATAYPAGSLIKYEGAADIYLVKSATEARKVATTEAFNANRYQDANVLTAPVTITYTKGTEITGAESALVDPSATGVTPGQPGVGSGMTVSLASTSAPSGTIITGQSIADLATYNFTASNDGDVKVTSIKVKRGGVSADADLTNVYLYDGATRLTDNASVSAGYVTWNNSSGIFTVAKGTTKAISVKSDISSDSSGHTITIGIQAATDVTTDGAAINGTFPVTGNIMSVASASLANVDFAINTTPTTGSVDPQTDYTMWSNTVNFQTRAVYLQSMTFRQIGSVYQGDLKNFKLYISGTQIGETVAQTDSNGYITFKPATPYKVETGSREVKVVGDILNGSGRNFQLSLRRAADAVIVDSEYNANVLIRGNASLTTGTYAPHDSGTMSISSGELTITKKTDSASGNVVNNASQISLARFELKATGESMKVENIRVTYASTDANVQELRNGALFYNGVQVGSTADIKEDSYDTHYTEYSLGSSVIVVPGTPGILEVKADIYDGEGSTNHVSAGDKFTVSIAAGSSNVQRMTSLSYVSRPTAAVAANQLTVAEGGLTLAKYTGYSSQNAVAPQTAFKLGEWRLTAATTESVNLTSLEVTWAGTGSVNVPSQLTSAYLVYGTAETSPKSSVSTSTPDSWSVSKTIAANEVMSIALYANVAATTGAATDAGMTPTLTVKGTAANSGATANSSAVGGQTITWTSGSISTAVLSTPLDRVEFGGQTVEAAKYEITAVNDTYTLTDFAVKVASGSQAAISGVSLYDGTTLLNTTPTPMDTYYATTTGLNLEIKPGTAGKKTITVKLILNNVGTGNAAPGLDVATTLDSIKVRNSGGTESYASTDRVGHHIFVFNAYPVVKSVALSTTSLTNNASQDIYKFKIAPSAGGTIGVKQMKFDLIWTDEGPVVSALQLGSLKFYRDGSDITDLVEITDAAGTNAKQGGSALTEADTTGGITIGFIDSEEQIDAEHTYTIKATPANFDAGTTSSDQISITMKGDTTDGTTKKYTVATVSANKVWKLASTAAGITVSSYNFIWSDRSSTSHAATSGSSSADWFNGYLIKDLDLDSTVLKK